MTTADVAVVIVLLLTFFVPGLGIGFLFGRLWPAPRITAPTSQAFRRYDWQLDEDGDPDAD